MTNKILYVNKNHHQDKDETIYTFICASANETYNIALVRGIMIGAVAMFAFLLIVLGAGKI